MKTSSRRLQRLVAQVCEREMSTRDLQMGKSQEEALGGRGAEYRVIGHGIAPRYTPGEHMEGRLPDGSFRPAHPAEESGEKLEDGRPRRKLPDLTPGVVDIEAMKTKYEEERVKRVNATAKFDTNPNGRSRQFPRIAELAKQDSRFAQMLVDPYVVTPERPPRTDECKVAIVGAGYGGLTAGARCREAGFAANEIVLFDKGGDVGGTWYWNRYPGAMCDIESYCYMPLCDEIGYTPVEKYCHQPEMHLHSQMIAEKYGLYERCCLGTECRDMVWDDAAKHWVIHTDRDDAIKAKYIIVNFGFLTHPQLPGVPGWLDFEGHMFHTSRWDYSYTGGNPSGSLTKLQDKVVAIVGTGATGIQAVPHLGQWSKHLYVFQRTPSTMDVRNNRHTTPEYAKQYLSKPGWQKERMTNFGAWLGGTATEDMENLVNDGWTEGTKRTLAARRNPDGSLKKMTPAELRDANDRTDFEHVERIRMRIEQVVDDKKTAEALKPYFKLFCKRPCFHDDYLPTFNRPNVTLVDTNGEGIQGITKKGVIANGQEYAIDCLVLATGFETAFVTPQADIDPERARQKATNCGFNLVGKGGLALSDYWGEGPRTLRSIATRNFPNAFWLNGPQGAISSSATYTLDEFGTHIASILIKANGRTVECSKAAEDEYCDMVYEGSLAGRKFFAACTPGYYSNQGTVDLTTKSLSALYPKPARFFPMLHKLVEDSDQLNGFDVA